MELRIMTKAAIRRNGNIPFRKFNGRGFEILPSEGV
jgi:hypothetical protein